MKLSSNLFLKCYFPVNLLTRQRQNVTVETRGLRGTRLIRIFVIKMPPSQPRDAIVIALDVGKSVSTLHDNEEKTFFQSAQNCVSWIIQRKIISQSADVLSLLLIGSKDSGQVLEGNGYDNICGKFDFQVASWDMLKFIEKEIKTSDIESDWSGALIVSLEMLKEYEEFNSVSGKKIVVFSDFTKPGSDDLGGIIERILALNVEVTIIGPEHLQFSTDCGDIDEPKIKRKKLDKTLERQEGERIAFQLWKELPENVCICTFDSALKQLCSYTAKPKRLNYWNCIMDIGEVNINISVVKKTDPKAPKKFNTKFARPHTQVPGERASEEENGERFQETVPTIRDIVMHYKHETGVNNEFLDVEVKSEDTVEGFRYGRTIIPFTEEDKTAMKYESGAKSFSVVGFTRASSVPYYFLSGECAYLVVPKHKDKNAEVALSALIQGLKKTKCVAIVRRVYSYNWGLSLGVLYPVVEEILSDETSDVTYREALLFLELAFEDDVKPIDFPSLETVAKDLTPQQYEAVDGLIEGMNLMKADKGLRGEACEAFDLSFLHDYKEQFFHYCVIQRGLYPDKPLPTLLPPYIENFIKVPKAVEENCESAFRNIKTQFKIKKSSDPNGFPSSRWSGRIADAQHPRAMPHTQGHTELEHFSEASIQEEENPTRRTWMRLFRQGFPPEEELGKIFNAYKDAGDPELSEVTSSFGFVLSKIRKNHLKGDPTLYNRWMVGYKDHMSGKDGLKLKIWQVISEENLGLITNEENQTSNFSNAEAAEFLCLDVNGPHDREKQMPDVQLLDELIEEQTNIDFDS